jgi:FG-GAP-like repeat
LRLTIAVLFSAILLAGSRPPDIPFEKVVLDLGANEACTFADINGDGRLDIVAGENWFEAPNWPRHRFREFGFTNNYIDNFSDLALDVNGDGRIDLISVSWFSRRIAWFENPGAKDKRWVEHSIEAVSPVEFAFLVDLNNDGKAEEILPQFGDKKAPLAWYELKGGKFVKHVVDASSHGHGIGAGDVNGDGKNDVLTPDGWFEAPDWKFHPAFESKAFSFMHVTDVNGDGKNDVITSNAHDYGLLLFEQQSTGEWKKSVIDDSWSQGHAVTLVDLNGDGQLDILTGKRYMAHNGKDPGGREPLGIYWYERMKTESKIEWVRHVIDYGGRTGGGMQIPVADLDGDGDLDFAVGGKSGVFLFLNHSSNKATGSGSRSSQR